MSGPGRKKRGQGGTYNVSASGAGEQKSGGFTSPRLSGDRSTESSPNAGPLTSPRSRNGRQDRGEGRRGRGHGSPMSNMKDHGADAAYSRLLHVVMALLDQPVVVNVKSGDVWEGILASGSFLARDGNVGITLRNARKRKNGSKELESGTLVRTLLVRPVDLVSFSAMNVNLEALLRSEKGEFHTDGEISGAPLGEGEFRERELTPWKPDSAVDSSPAFAVSLEHVAKGSTGWDQFATNEKLFGVKSTFDENLYTTPLEKDSMDRSIRRKAERIAAELSRAPTANENPHVLEERGIETESADGPDEEDRYSAVRSASPVVSRPYVIPAKRDAGSGSLPVQPKSPSSEVAQLKSPVVVERSLFLPSATAPVTDNSERPTTPPDAGRRSGSSGSGGPAGFVPKQLAKTLGGLRRYSSCGAIRLLDGKEEMPPFVPRFRSHEEVLDAHCRMHSGVVAERFGRVTKSPLLSSITPSRSASLENLSRGRESPLLQPRTGWSPSKIDALHLDPAVPITSAEVWKQLGEFKRLHRAACRPRTRQETLEDLRSFGKKLVVKAAEDLDQRRELLKEQRYRSGSGAVQASPQQQRYLRALMEEGTGAGSESGKTGSSLAKFPSPTALDRGERPRLAASGKQQQSQSTEAQTTAAQRVGRTPLLSSSQPPQQSLSSSAASPAPVTTPKKKLDPGAKPFVFKGSAPAFTPSRRISSPAQNIRIQQAQTQFPAQRFSPVVGAVGSPALLPTAALPSGAAEPLQPQFDLSAPLSVVYAMGMALEGRKDPSLRTHTWNVGVGIGGLGLHPGAPQQLQHRSPVIMNLSPVGRVMNHQRPVSHQQVPVQVPVAVTGGPAVVRGTGGGGEPTVVVARPPEERNTLFGTPPRAAFVSAPVQAQTTGYAVSGYPPPGSSIYSHSPAAPHSSSDHHQRLGVASSSFVPSHLVAHPHPHAHSAQGHHPGTLVSVQPIAALPAPLWVRGAAAPPTAPAGSGQAAPMAAVAQQSGAVQPGVGGVGTQQSRQQQPYVYVPAGAMHQHTGQPPNALYASAAPGPAAVGVGVQQQQHGGSMSVPGASAQGVVSFPPLQGGIPGMLVQTQAQAQAHAAAANTAAAAGKRFVPPSAMMFHGSAVGTLPAHST